jgi:hypothetical protein
MVIENCKDYEGDHTINTTGRCEESALAILKVRTVENPMYLQHTDAATEFFLISDRLL